MKGEKSMSNPNFVPNWSTNDVYRDLNTERCLTDDLDAIELGLAGKAEAGHTHTEYASSAHTHSEYAPSTHEHTGYAAASHEHTGYAATNHEHEEYAPANHSHAEYAPSEHTHAGYATSNHVHTEYAPASHEHAGYAPSNHTHTGFAAENHTHDTAYSAKSLQPTSDTGSFKYSYRIDDGKNVLDEIKTLPTGLFTVYSQSGVSGNPKSVEAWRFLVHKTGDTVLWVKAFGSMGSEYSNYCADGVWQGWKCIFDKQPEPLWTGEMYMAGNHTIIPTKTLSDCAHGWLLLWGDYNPGEGSQNTDFASSVIPKKAYTGQNWNGGQWLFPVPRYSDSGGDGIIVKTLQVFDNKLVGNDNNSISPRNDVVLRAIYEF